MKKILQIKLSNQLSFLYTEAKNIGETLLEKKCYYLAAIWFYRLTEIYAKISNRDTFAKFEAIEAELISRKKDIEIAWNESCITKNAESIQKLSAQSIHSLKKCSSIFALTHDANRTEFPVYRNEWERYKKGEISSSVLSDIIFPKYSKKASE